MFGIMSGWVEKFTAIELKARGVRRGQAYGSERTLEKSREILLITSAGI